MESGTLFVREIQEISVIAFLPTVFWEFCENCMNRMKIKGVRIFVNFIYFTLIIIKY